MIKKSEFEDLILSGKEIKILKKLNKNESLIIDSKLVKELVENGFVNLYPDRYDKFGNPVYKDKYCINNKGKKYLTYLRIKSFKSNDELFKDLFTMLMAISGFVLSCLSLILQSKN